MLVSFADRVKKAREDSGSGRSLTLLTYVTLAAGFGNQFPDLKQEHAAKNAKLPGMTEMKERKRLDDLKRSPAEHARRTDAKTFKLPLAALKIIEKAGEVHGQQSRAIEVSVELLWHGVGTRVPDADMSAMKESAITAKTYRLPPRTIDLIQALSPRIRHTGECSCGVSLHAVEA